MIPRLRLRLRLRPALAALLAAALALPAAAGEPAPLPSAEERPPLMQQFLSQLLDPGGARDRSIAVDPSLAAVPAADDFAGALASYRQGGEPAILGTPAGRVWPFGHGVPTLTCLPLRACDVALEPGETLLGWAIGDSERWLAEELVEGAPPGERPHLLLKPTDLGLATNLVLLTDRRAYHLELVSPDLEDDATQATAYDHRVSWWYPDDWVRRLERSAADRAARADAAATQHAAAVEIDRPLDPGRLSFSYRIEPPFWPSRRLPWRPLTVFDDGERVYLRLPPGARRHELPVLLGRLGDGTTYPLATRVEGDWLVVPTLFDRAELVLGTGDRRRSLTVVSEASAGDPEATR